MQMRRHALLMLLRIRILEKGSHLQPIRDHLRLWIPGPPLPLLALREHRWGESRAMCSGQPETKTTKTTKTGPELVPMTPGIGEVITMLRSAEARLHFGAPLGVLGLVLMLAGGVWALTRFLVNNSFIFLLLAGLMCVLVSLAADPRGLLRYVPEEMQDFLFNKRVFDILYDDTPVINAIRKWGPVQLLISQDGTSQGAIRHLVEHTEPEVLRFVLCRSFFSFLPGPLRLLLLPARSLSKEGLEESDTPPSVEWVQDFLQDRNEKKQQKIKYPELLPLVTKTMGLDFAPFKSIGRSFFRWLSTFTFIGGLASCLDSRAVQTVTGGLIRETRTSRLAAALTLCSAGGAIAVSLFFERCHRLFEEGGRLKERDWHVTEADDGEGEEEDGVVFQDEQPSKFQEYMSIFFDYIFWILLAYCAVNALIWLGEKMGLRAQRGGDEVSARENSSGHIESNFSVRYGPMPFTIKEHYQSHGLGHGVYRKSVSIPFGIPGGSLLGFPSAIVDVVSKGDTYDALIIYSCLAGLQVLEISTRAQHITDAAAQSLVDRALALGVKLAKESVQRVRHSDCDVVNLI
ncbi:Uncharacterized protein SCF082_LOCUS770 [Durusdinium trenchii]|uniref:Uncharacterized protein n=1 Tax=Durusdinium trenchii TaxID=1381693 RepID=A0ABP0HBS9_9DINO